MRHGNRLLSLIALGVVAACGGSQDSATKDAAPRTVLVATLERAPGESLELSGAIRAERETPLAFRIGGQIEKRTVLAGERVKSGQVLMALDPRDVRQQIRAAEAELASATARAANAEAERARYERLLASDVASRQSFDAVATAAKAANEAKSAARANLAQARNAGAYAELAAPADGVLVEVTGEVGQVVAPGQAVAVIAHDGAREIEVFVPETRRASLAERGEARLFGGERTAGATLREVAGAADPVSRTSRARYRLDDAAADWPLGASASLRTDGAAREGGGTLMRVPIGAVLDAGGGPSLLVIRDGHVEPASVRLARVDEEYAYVETDLAEGTPVVALGVQLLTPGQAVATRP